jgi:hypothetical protein
MSAFSYDNIIVISPWDILSINELKLTSELNQHTELYISALLNEEAGQKAGLKETADDQIKVGLQDGAAKKLIFTGRLKEVDVSAKAGLYTLKASFLAETSVLDKKEKSRSFQDIRLTYPDIVSKVLQDYPGKRFALTVDKVAINGPIIQYKETDWAFIKRLASLLETVVVCDGAVQDQLFSFGYPRGSSKTLPATAKYTTGKDIRAYNEDSLYNPNLPLNEYTYYEISGYDELKIGDRVTVQGSEMHIGAVTVEFKQGMLVYTAKLVRKPTIRQNPIYNSKIRGASLEGTVIDLKEQAVKLHLTIDKEQPKEEAYWYPFVPPTTDALYLMPQMHTSASLYIPGLQEQKAIITGCVRKNGDECPKTADPDTRYLGTEYGQELKITPGGIYITAGNTQLVVTLDDEKGITLSSHNRMNIDAYQDMTFVSEKKVAFRGKTRLLTVAPDEFFRLAGALQENETHIRAPMVFMDMSQSTEYEPLEQPKPPEPFYKRVDWKKLAIVTVVGAATAVACAVLFPEILLVAGVAAGTAASSAITWTMVAAVSGAVATKR